MSPEKTTRPLSQNEAKAFSWRTEKPVEVVFSILNNEDKARARFVGGCVRDSLIGIRPKDIDVATSYLPGEVSDLLSAAGVSVVPTGIDHGTVTAVVDHHPVEITTLRSDVSTDGRRATVKFSKDWKDDAARRDFTINALYLDAQGNIHDYNKGLEDLEKRCVRFIGDAETRIQEDYLRILRFFRFSGRFSAEGYDQIGLNACRKLNNGIGSLSRERIGDEFSKILSHQSAAQCLLTMKDIGVLQEIWPHPPNIAILEHLPVEAGIAVSLAALWGKNCDGLGQALRLSNEVNARRKAAATNIVRFASSDGLADLRRLAYDIGAERLKDCLYLVRAQSENETSRTNAFADEIERWSIPKFPFLGRDITAQGVPSGKLVGSVLKRTEERWIDEDFPESRRLDEIFREECTEAKRSAT